MLGVTSTRLAAYTGYAEGARAGISAQLLALQRLLRSRPSMAFAAPERPVQWSWRPTPCGYDADEVYQRTPPR